MSSGGSRTWDSKMIPPTRIGFSVAVCKFVTWYSNGLDYFRLSTNLPQPLFCLQQVKVVDILSLYVFNKREIVKPCLWLGLFRSYNVCTVHVLREIFCKTFLFFMVWTPLIFIFSMIVLCYLFKKSYIGVLILFLEILEFQKKHLATFVISFSLLHLKPRGPGWCVY